MITAFIIILSVLTLAFAALMWASGIVLDNLSKAQENIMREFE